MDMKWVFITGCDSGFGAIMVEKIKAMRGVGVFAGCYLADTVDTYNGLGRNDLFAIRIDVTDVESVLGYLAISAGVRTFANRFGV